MLHGWRVTVSGGGSRSRTGWRRGDAERRNLWLAKAALAELPRALQDVFVHRWYAAAETKDGDEKARGLIDHLDGRKDLVPETAFGGAEVSQSFREWC